MTRATTLPLRLTAPATISFDQLTRGATPTRPLAAVLVLGLAADVGLVRFHDAHELAKLGVGKAGADAVAHIVGSAVGAEAHYALHFERGHALLGGHHHVDDPEPVPQAHIRVLENGPDQYREAIAVRRTCLALPMERTSLQLGHLVVAAARAADTFGPAPPQKVSLAGVVVREQRLELADRHLFGELSHGRHPRVR